MTRNRMRNTVILKPLKAKAKVSILTVIAVFSAPTINRVFEA